MPKRGGNESYIVNGDRSGGAGTTRALARLPARPKDFDDSHSKVPPLISRCVMSGSTLTVKADCTMIFSGITIHRLNALRCRIPLGLKAAAIFISMHLIHLGGLISRDYQVIPECISQKVMRFAHMMIRL